MHYAVFEKWLDETMRRGIPENVSALNFNLYEDGEDLWSAELVGTESFDPDDSDWACDEIFDNRETPLSRNEEADWETILSKVQGIVEEYLQKGTYAQQLRQYRGIGVGFVEGDIELVYVK